MQSFGPKGFRIGPRYVFLLMIQLSFLSGRLIPHLHKPSAKIVALIAIRDIPPNLRNFIGDMITSRRSAEEQKD